MFFAFCQVGIKYEISPDSLLDNPLLKINKKNYFQLVLSLSMPWDPGFHSLTLFLDFVI